jgi:Ca-activated chloride channel family protein
LTALASTPTPAQDDGVIEVDSSMVLVNTAVLDSAGKPVRDLKKDHFKVLEDGKEQEIALFAAEEVPFAAVILIDTSGSMEERITLARSAAITFLDGIRPQDAVAIYKFDSSVDRVREFSNTRDLSDRFFDLRSRGMTTLNDAIYKAASDLSKRSEKRRAIIVLSDGMDTSSRRSAEKALKAALEVDASIFAVDMSPINGPVAQRTQNQAALRKFAEKTGGTFVATPGGTALREAFAGIVEDLGTQYTLGYSPLASTRDGKWHEIEVRVAKPNLTVRARKGYNAEKGRQ